MGKLFGVILTIIALASAYPIVTHMYVQPVDISTHGHAIDEQLADTMAEAGLSFVLAQLLLAFCVWKFSNRKEGAKVFHVWGGAKLMVVGAFILVGTEVLALGVFGKKPGRQSISRHPNRTLCRFRPRPGSLLFIFDIPVRTASSVHSIPTKLTKEIRITSGWTPPTTWRPETISLRRKWPFP
jgi:hypothetical protein